MSSPCTIGFEFSVGDLVRRKFGKLDTPTPMTGRVLALAYDDHGARAFVVPSDAWTGGSTATWWPCSSLEDAEPRP